MGNVGGSVSRSCELSFASSLLPPRSPGKESLFWLGCGRLPMTWVNRRLILTHATLWTLPLLMHKVIAVRECALRRVAGAPQAQRVRLGNKRAKSVPLKHSQILRLSLCCYGWGLTVMNIGQKLVFHMMIFPNENWWMRRGWVGIVWWEEGPLIRKPVMLSRATLRWAGRTAGPRGATPAVLQKNISWYGGSIWGLKWDISIWENKSMSNSSRCIFSFF